MFDTDSFLADCVSAAREPDARLAVKEVLARATADPAAMARTLPPERAGITKLHVSPEVTVLQVVWAPGMSFGPHDHRMWAAIGIYTGREDNTMYRRIGAEPRHLTESGGQSLDEGDVLLLGDDVIHSVSNTLTRLTGAIHVYGGDFVHEPRSQWGPGPREERPFDFDEAGQQFAEANEAWREASASG